MPLAALSPVEKLPPRGLLPAKLGGGWENIAAVKDRKEAAPGEEKLETIEGGRDR